ncbi:hypothetical protein A3G67_04090 [Candidatus Roizmanbacteria bacterium RIFCSPLOWO2_12_FULL_40_12]|nr:MAG: hypothetical protein A2W49_01655 [Candidatus Roizmanbacteria bacterium RIFCSPHIGHO2_12_41_18]OGK58763.1 MAG: hypothetical protein A3H84_02495 [Candidatus Roizmanbacteria bacterium RIFCSPLOWO2_02_FULL_40_13]OGK60914.1 MAG: hypothetical protein A3G67_04090 [Candidatus Roizmanbacteria bacterium RIFCSPLOWO2_12_FULL_40_12]
MPQKLNTSAKKVVKDSSSVAPVIGQVPDHEPPTPYLQQAPPSFKPFRFIGMSIFLILLLIVLVLFSGYLFFTVLSK